MKPVRDSKSVLTDLKNVLYMPFKYETHLDGSGDYRCTMDMLRQVKKVIQDAIDLIEYLIRERDSLMDLLEDNNGDN